MTKKKPQKKTALAKTPPQNNPDRPEANRVNERKKDMKNDKTTGRLKVFIVSRRHILGMLTWRQHEVVGLPVIQGLPRDASIREVEYRVECRGWALLVEHESFPPVSPGSRVPYADTSLATDFLCFIRNPNGTYTVPDMPELPTIHDTLDGSGKGETGEEEKEGESH